MRHGAMRNELTVESSFSQLCTGFQITRYLGIYWFFSMQFMEQKMFLFSHIIDIQDEPAQPDPARPGLTQPDSTCCSGGVISETGFLLQTLMGRHFITCVDYILKKKKNYSLSHTEKIKSLRDIALFENPYMTVKTRSWLQARSTSLRVARNYLTEEQNLS